MYHLPKSQTKFKTYKQESVDHWLKYTPFQISYIFHGVDDMAAWKKMSTTGINDGMSLYMYSTPVYL